MRKKNFSNFHIYDVITKHNKQINKNNRISNNLNWTIYMKKKQKQKISIREKKTKQNIKVTPKNFRLIFHPQHTQIFLGKKWWQKTTKTSGSPLSLMFLRLNHIIFIVFHKKIYYPLSCLQDDVDVILHDTTKRLSDSRLKVERDSWDSFCFNIVVHLSLLWLL
jgi:hypothetical protein